MTPSLGPSISPGNPHGTEGWALLDSNQRPPACRAGNGLLRCLSAFYASALSRHDPRLDPEGNPSTPEYPGVRPGVPHMYPQRNP